MKRLILNRTYFKDATLGHLYIEGEDNPVWHTIERPWLNNQPYESCIPEGIYKVSRYSSAKYTDVWQVKDVPNRTAILIHPANYVRELQGCIAPGLSAGYMNGAKAVLSSKDALKSMKYKLGYPSDFELEVRS